MMTTQERSDTIAEGERDYLEWRASLQDTPDKAARYADIAAKSDLWLQLVEARRSTGLSQRALAKRLGVSQAQVARIEKRGYESYTLNTLRRYLAALGQGYVLDVRVEQRGSAVSEAAPAAR